MSTSEYETIENQITCEYDGEYYPVPASVEICNECGCAQIPDHGYPVTPPSRPESPPICSRPGTSIDSRPVTVRPKTPIEQTIVPEKLLLTPTVPPASNIDQQYSTECDLSATSAPVELLPHIETTPKAASTKNEEKPVIVADMKKEKPKKAIPIKSRIASAIPKRNEPIISNSAIPIKVTRQSSRLSIKPSRTGSFSKSQLKTPKLAINKHTLEVQFMNKNKRLIQLKKDLLEKQRPIMDLYQNMLEIKKQLSEFGKIVEIEEIKLVSMDEPKKKVDNPCGDVLSQEIVQNMKTSIEDIPKALMGACKNLVGRRDAIVDLLECVSQANIEPTELADKIETLKNEGRELKNSLDTLITQSEARISELVKNWYILLNNKNNETANMKVEEYETQLKQKESMLQESKQVILDLQRKLEEKRNLHEKAISEFEITVKGYTENIKKLNHELEVEKRNATEIKTRNTGNSQTIKALRQRLTEAEAKVKDVDNKNNDLNKKLKIFTDQQRQKEVNWNKEKDEMQKNIKEQDKLLSKLNEDRNSFQTRLAVTQNNKKNEEENLKKEIDTLKSELEKINEKYEETEKCKIEVTEKCENLEKELEKLGHENERNMETISKQIDWGQPLPCQDAQAELYSELLATKVTIREYEEKIKSYEKESINWENERRDLLDKMNNGQLSINYRRQEEIINKYKDLLQESEIKLNEKSVEVAKLNAELKHLKIRQDALEEQNLNCPTEELRQMVSDGRQKLSDIMKKSMENEQKLSVYENTIEKQQKQMNEMENLLKVRDGLIGMIKAKKDELLMEKDSLTRYCKDVRNMLAETREDLRIKSEIIRDLQEKLEKKDKTCTIFEKKIRELEENLAYTNEKRFKLQDTIGTMEKELQSTKAHVNQMAELQSRYDLGMTNSKNNFISSQNPTFESLTFHQHIGEFNLDLPINEMDYIRRRLYQLSNFNLEESGLKINKKIKKPKSLNVLHSTKSLYEFTTKNNYQKMIELESKRYEILQKQTDESYENLSNLLRLSMPPSENPVRDRSGDVTESDAMSLVTGNNQLSESEQPFKLSKHKQFGINPKLRYNKIYLSHLSETYKDLNDSLTIIKNTLTEVDEMKNSREFK